MSTMAEARRRQDAKGAFNAATDDRSTHQLLGIIAGEGSSMIMLELEKGTRGQADLGRALPGVSAETLVQTLRSLERDGFVARSAVPSVPEQDEYTLTVLGERLIPLLDSVRHWAQRNMGEVRAARAHHDAVEG
ncbi:winged helix-turn-helix transcriptional regulator [Actinomadura rubrisoli]|uniref:Transcriptional regulator n=1 Tax=Actinomadura rubrisoli TaxID=2530368 RepID=A0A4R5B5S2_9ACTN|nr:helix-turn-helix domain-containing protein [Actinomadura rubrisoli]TDD81191.1 transcriptional regulator [Actinomadura rubrisoli]